MCGQPEGLAMQVPRAVDAHLAAGLPALASPALARDGRNPGIDVEAGLHVAIAQAAVLDIEPTDHRHFVTVVGRGGIGSLLGAARPVRAAVSLALDRKSGV